MLALAATAVVVLWVDRSMTRADRKWVLLFEIAGAVISLVLFGLAVLQARARVAAERERHAAIREAQERQRAEEALRTQNVEMSEQARALETLNQIGAQLAAQLDLQKLVQHVTDAGTQLSGAQFGAFFYNVISDAGQSYTLYTISGVPREAFAKFPMPRNTAVFGPTFAGEGVVRSDDITKDPRYGKSAPHHGMPAGHLPVRSYLAVPVVSRSGEVLGGLFFGHPQVGVFNERAERMVTTLASQAAVAIDNARLYESARRNQDQLKLITDALPVLVSYVDCDERYRFNNRRYELWFGTPAERLYGKTMREVLGDEAYSLIKPHVEEALHGKTAVFEATLPYTHGGARRVECTYVPDRDETGQVRGFYVMVHDLTERMRGEQALRDSEERLRLALQAGHIGAWDWDVARDQVNWSELLFQIHGVKQDEFKPSIDAFQHLVHPDDLPSVREALRCTLEEGAPYELEFRILQPNGEVRWVFTAASVVRDEHGAPVKLFGATVDITERKRHLEAIRQSEEQYRAAFELAAVGTAQVDPETGAFLRVNRKLCEITGYSEDELLALTFSQILHPDDRGVTFDELQRLVRGEIVEATVETRCVRKDGEIAWLDVNTAIARDSEGKSLHAVSVVQDVSGRKNAEAELILHRERLEELITQRTQELEESHEKLRLSERLAALGTLSAGLGHDMGNLLLPLRLRIDSMVTKGVPADMNEDLDAIRKCAEYLQRLANGLRLFALDPDKSDTTADRTNLHDWWPDVYSFFKNALPRHVALEQRFDADIPEVKLAKPNLTQALFNLVQNAGDAMKSRESGHVVVWAEPGAGGRTIRLGVTDDGPGMSPEVRRRCMEPFYTTKTRAISTGLGLALVHGIVQKAGGEVEIHSDLGRGTTFIMTLPAAVGLPSQNGHARQDVRPIAVVSLRDDRLRAYVISILNALGFDVCWQDRPSEAATRVWVADCSDGAPSALPRFIAEHPGRQAVLFGDDLPPPNSPSILHIESAPKPSVIRQTLREMAARVDSEHVTVRN